MLAQLIQTAFRTLPPQTAHRLLLSNLGWMTTFNLHQEFARNSPDFSRTVMGIRFPNCIGLAAGFDQNGSCITPLGALGFGHIEVGSVTLQTQAQAMVVTRNKDRLSISHSTSNCSEGIDTVVQHIQKSAPGFRLRGGIVGLNIATSFENANAEDPCQTLRKGYRYTDYFVLNLANQSFRDLQSPDTVRRLLKMVDTERARLIEHEGNTRKPIAVKLAAGLTEDVLCHLLDSIVDSNMDGIIAFGPSARQPGTQNSELLSGAPIADQCLSGLTHVIEHLQGRLPVIASGGLTDAQHISYVAQTGANLVQIHSGFVFHGPRFVADAIEAFEEHSLKFHNVKR